MRRSERAITELSGILAVLDKCEVVRLGLCAADVPYIVPLHFAYTVENGAVSLFMHGAGEGRKIDMLRQNGNVCFEADILHEIVRPPEACGWTARYECVMGEGTVSLCEDPADKEAALTLLMRRYGFAGEARMDAAMLERTAVLRVRVTALTGKRNGGFGKEKQSNQGGNEDGESGQRL